MSLICFRLLLGLTLHVKALSAQSCGCTSGETCCSDPAGYSCCIDQVDYCVPPRGTFSVATCCPLWTIGCTIGSVGCCDPARPWQVLDPASNLTTPIGDIAVLRKPSVQLAKSSAGEVEMQELEPARTSTPATAYALFSRTFGDGLAALAIDAAAGTVLSKSIVNGPAADYIAGYFGGSTRIFPWATLLSRFVFADVDKSQTSQPLTVYTIDPATGNSTQMAVSGCGTNSYPLGMAWDQVTGKLLLGMHDKTDVVFCAVDVLSGDGTPQGRIPRGSNDDSANYFSAYISHTHNGTAYRVGHKHVGIGAGPGVGVTPLAVASISNSSWKDIDISGHGHAISVQRHPQGGFVSLAPRTGGKLDVVAWALDGSSRLVSQLDNANMPKLFGTEVLGYVADSVATDTYAAMTIQKAPFADKWAVSTVSLSTGNKTEVALDQQPGALGAETVSLSGFGLVHFENA